MSKRQNLRELVEVQNVKGSDLIVLQGKGQGQFTTLPISTMYICYAACMI